VVFWPNEALLKYIPCLAKNNGRPQIITTRPKNDNGHPKIIIPVLEKTLDIQNKFHRPKRPWPSKNCPEHPKGILPVSHK